MHLFIYVLGYLLRADDSIISIPALERNCYFENESNLELYSKYTYTNCR